MPLNDTSVIAGKIETPTGTWAAPTVAADGDLVFDYAMTLLESDVVYRPVEAGFAGAKPALVSKVRARHEFSMELTGGGVPAGTTPPRWMRYLRACLMAAPQTLADRVTMAPASAGDGDSISLLGFKDVARGQARAARGNAVLTFPEGGVPFVRFSYLGLIEGAPLGRAAPGALAAASTVRPVEVNAANSSVALDGYVLGMKSLAIDLGNKVEFYTTTAAQGVIFGKGEDGDRRSAGVTLRAELPDPSDKNYFDAVVPGQLLALAWTHGTQPGNIVQGGGQVQVTGITLAVEQGKMFMELAGKLVPTASNNELLLTTR